MNTETTKKQKLKPKMPDGQICTGMKTHFQMLKKIWLPELTSDPSNDEPFAETSNEKLIKVNGNGASKNKKRQFSNAYHSLYNNYIHTFIIQAFLYKI